MYVCMYYYYYFYRSRFKNFGIFFFFYCCCVGETTRKGFYVYNDKRKASPDPEIKKYIDKAREMTGVSIDPKVIHSISLSLHI